jgi:hypothetical protein
VEKRKKPLVRAEISTTDRILQSDYDYAIAAPPSVTFCPFLPVIKAY